MAHSLKALRYRVASALQPDDVGVTVASAAVEEAQHRRNARDNASRWNLNDDTALTQVTTTGLTVTGGWLAATVGGTAGTLTRTHWRAEHDGRVTARVKITKATTGSESLVGYTPVARGTTPTGTSGSASYVIGVGYLQGTGLAIIRTGIGAATVLLADASLTDGAEYDVSAHLDTTLATAAGGNIVFSARVRTTAGVDVATNVVTLSPAFYSLTQFLARTNVAAGGLTNIQLVDHPTAPAGVRTWSSAMAYTTDAAETVGLHIPATPNGGLVLALHGHGGSPTETGWTSTSYAPTWSALNAAGYTVAVPRMGGDLWGNPTALAHLVTLVDKLTRYYDLDPEVYLWGNSMGGGAALTAIATKTLKVRAAYLAQPATDYAALWTNPSFPTLPTAYGNSTTSRDASNPIAQPAANYAGVPLLFVASASDTTISKTAHTDAMRTHLGANTTHYLLTATGNHNDATHFKAAETVAFFRANA